MGLSSVRLAAVAARALRTGQHVGFATLILCLGCASLGTAAAGGDTRTLTFHHQHTGEDLTVTYMRDGRYDDEALKKINWELRDWRRNEAVRIDPKVIDAVWELYRAVDGKDGIEIICGYRAPATNSMLRRRSSGVAESSQHTLGKAIDLHIRNVPLEKQRAAAMRLQRGGVGFYPSSQFIHVDVASVRHWPRMTPEQLARVFPDGRTVHVPTSGKPMANYQLALADVAKRGNAPSQTSVEAARAAGIDVAAAPTAKPGKNLFASLFSSLKGDDDDDAASAADAATRAVAPPAASRPSRSDTRQGVASRTVRTVTAPPVVAAPSPLPSRAPAPVRPASAGTVTVAAADSSVSVPFVDDPPRPRAELGQTTEAPASGQENTGTLALPTAAGEAADRVPLDIALAYAAEPIARPAAAAPRASAGTSLVDRTQPGVGTETRIADQSPLTMAKKVYARVPAGHETTAKLAATGRTATVAVVPGARFDDPWLRAVMMAPSLYTALTVTTYGEPDYSDLTVMMNKPSGSVVMTFSAEPYPGMRCDRFSGGAVVFLSTVTFQRTAALR